MAEHHFDYAHISHPALATFAERVRAFCSVVDRGFERNEETCLSELHRVLAQLYTAALELPSTDILWDLDEEETEDDDADDAVQPYTYEPDPDRLSEEDLRDVYAGLAERFESSNYYREVFDPYDAIEKEEVTGSLADDISDIYQDIRGGLVKWDRGESAEALWEWRFNLEVHWGEHATGALRALNARAAWRGGTWPAGDPSTATRERSDV